jgi:hypothetical protein
VLSGLVPEALVHALSAWIAAGVAGLLMHVVTHDLGRDLPTTQAARALDVAAAAFGVGTSLLGGDAALVALRSELGRVFLQLLELGAPALVLGWLVALLLGRLEAGAAGHWLRVLPGRARGLDGALVGTAIAGPRFGILFWVGTALSARLVALRTPTDPPAHLHDSAHESHAHSHAGAREHPLALCVRESAPWIVTGAVLATLLIAALREQSLAGLSAPVALALAAVFALPLRLPPVAAVLIAIGLWDRGLRADAALAFALMAAARKFGARPLALALLVGLGVGSVNQRSDLYLRIPHAVSVTGIVLLALGIALATWERGIRGLFTGVFHAHDSA